MSLTTEDIKNLAQLNAVFTRIEDEAEELGLTPSDESFAQYKKYHVGGVALFDQDVPAISTERANIFAKATDVKKSADEKINK